MSEVQVSVKNTSALGREVTITVPEQNFIAEKKSQLQDVSKKAKISGFRVGHVPVKIIEKRFGKQIHQDVISKIAEREVPKAIKQQELNIVGTPILNDVKDSVGADLILTINLEVFPEINLCELSEIVIEKPIVTIEQQDVDKSVTELKEKFAMWDKNNDKSVESGDKVLIDFVGTIEGKTFSGGSANDVTVEIGANNFIKEFEQGLIGTKVDEVKQISFNFPEDYSAKDLAGKPVNFEVTIKEIEVKKLAELDENFAAKLNIPDNNVAAINDKIKENLQNFANEVINNRMRDTAFEKLQELNDINLPEYLLQNEEQAIIKNYKKSVKSSDNDAASLNMEEIKQEAKKRTHLAILLRHIVDQEKIEVDQEKVKLKISTMAKQLGNFDFIENLYYESKELQDNIQSMVLTEQVADFIISKATIEEKSMTFQEVVNPEKDD